MSVHSIETEERLTDEELVLRIIEDNDTQLFGELYDRCAGMIYNKCLSFVNSKDEAQDMTHDIFVKLFVKLKTFKGNAKFSTWLYAFTYHFCINHVQRDLKYEKDVEDLDVVLDDVEEISDEAICQMKAEKLISALNKIDAQDKVLLLMKYQDDLSIKDLCEIHQAKESAMKMRLNRAKTKLIKIYNNL